MYIVSVLGWPCCEAVHWLGAFERLLWKFAHCPALLGELPSAMSYMLVNNGLFREKFHRGSAPNLLAPPRVESLRPLHKRLSMEAMKSKAPDLGPIKWPSLVTICKWKQSLTERLLKRHRRSCSQVSSSLFSLTIKFITGRTKQLNLLDSVSQTIKTEWFSKQTLKNNTCSQFSIGPFNRLLAFVR